MSTIEPEVGPRQPRWLEDAEERAWRGYMRMRTLLHARIVGDLAREAGLSGPDYDVLSHVSESPGRRSRLGELAERITRMERRGLVTRQECPSDGRGAFVVLTDAGFLLIQAAAPGHVASVRRNFVDLLSREQLDALTSITDTVVGHLAEAEPS
jgi:DNA-binding MarR family transcriptional regulator